MSDYYDQWGDELDRDAHEVESQKLHNGYETVKEVKWLTGEVRHRNCGGRIDDSHVCKTCGTSVVRPEQMEVW